MYTNGNRRTLWEIWIVGIKWRLSLGRHDRICLWTRNNICKATIKIQAGTQNIGGAVGLAAAIDYLENRMDNVEK